MAQVPKALSLIVACAENRVMGRSGKLPWQIPEDRAWLNEHTRGQIVIMGRLCYEAWSRVHEEGRRPFVITQRTAEQLRRHAMPAGVAGPRVASSVQEALQGAQKLPGEVFVCGGARIFEETLPLAQRLYLTLVHTETEGDILFPEWRRITWRESYRREGVDGANRYTFSILERQSFECGG